MFNTDRYLITVAEMPSFARSAEKVFTVEELNLLVDTLALNPLTGDVIDDTGGLRMIRWPSLQLGKKACVRVIYYFRDLNNPVCLLALYRKGERFSLSTEEKTEMRRLVDNMLDANKAKWAAATTSNDVA